MALLSTFASAQALALAAFANDNAHTGSSSEPGMLVAYLGNFALMLGLALAAFATISSLMAGLKAREKFRLAAVRALIGSTLLVFLAIFCLAYLLHTDAFFVRYVYAHSNITLSPVFKTTAVWAGSEGSLLWWTMIVCVYTCVMLALTRKAPRLMMSWAYFFVGLAVFFFLLINNVVANPFQLWGEYHAGHGHAPVPFTPPDGTGLNPQLQHWAMIIHPPLLYTGYIGFLFPFAMAMGALVTRMESRDWIPLIRRWTLTAWLILGVGIILGGGWAYMELGWGGYWAWDPVENASFMPWLIGTAFFHSTMAQERRGMLKIWNMWLLVATYLMCIFGTFITRSGLISSVHAFAASDIGYYFIGYLIVNLFLAGFIITLRHDQLRADNSIESSSSREVGMLFNNVVFTAICGATLLGTVWPMITEAAVGVKRELRHGFYNTVTVPIFWILILLMAVGPLLTWKRTSKQQLSKRLIPAVIGAVITAGFAFWLNPIFFDGVRDDTALYANISMVTLGFLLVTIVHEFTLVVGRRMSRAKENPFTALYNTVSMNKRRYGGYIAHFSILLMGIGLVGAAFNHQDKKDLGVGETMRVGDYTFQIGSIDVAMDDPNFQALTAVVNLMENGKVVKSFHPEQRFYRASQAQASEVAIWSTLARDYYVVLAGAGEGSTTEHPIGSFHIYVNPLTKWIWIGGFVMIFGTLICMLPDKSRAAARVRVPVGEGEPA